MADSYRVVVTREGANWLAEVEGMAGGHTFGPSLQSLLRSVREVIILSADLPDDAEVDLELVFDVEDDLVREAAEVGARRRHLAAEQQEVASKTEDLAVRLTGHVSVRDAAALLGVTPGRISQLTGR